MIIPLEFDFSCFSSKYIRSSYSQCLQDLFALYVSDRKTDGYFVEFGALNGVDFSNSYLLERLGWRGIVAEPHPAYGDLLRSRRACHVSTKCVYSHSGRTVEFLAYRGRPAASTMSETRPDERSDWQHTAHNVETITLPDLLSEFNAPSFVDFLSIDTEGSEHLILSAHDFARYTFGAIAVEHNYSKQRDSLLTLLTIHGYVRVLQQFSRHDDWYVHRDVVDRPRPPRWSEALDDRIQAAAHDSHLNKRYETLSTTLAAAGQVEAALQFAHKALSLAPADAGHILQLGALLVRSGRGEEATEVLGPAVAAGSATPEQHFQLALARMMCGAPDEAKAFAKTALARAPGNRKFQGLVAWL